MEKLAVIILLLCLVPNLAQANSLEEGKQAYLNKDYKKAMEMLKPLAEAGNSEAQVTVGIMYDYGHGTAANPEEAFKWYKKAAEQGIPVVQHDLGVKYFQGIGTEQDYAEASKWWEMSANAGLADSQFNLGLMYYRGLGHKQDYARAIDLFTKAANQGHGHAQYSLAVMHAFGQGVENNYQKALSWFRKSAAQDIAQAQYNLGVFYENGYGVSADKTIAQEWYKKAAAQNLPEARQKLKTLQAAEAKPESINITENTIVQPSPAYPVREKPQAKLPAAKLQPSEELEVSKPMAAKTAVPATVSAPNSTGDIMDENWVRQQAPNDYTIQIASSTSEAGIIKFLKQNNLSEVTAYVRVFVKGAYRYSALYGSFGSRQQANQAISSLPAGIQATKPWVRRFKTVQELLNASR